MQSYELLCCPTCLGRLQPDRGELTCSGCGAHWPVKDSVPLFWMHRKDNTLSPERWAEINSLAAAQGWKHVASVCPRQSPDYRPDTSLYLEGYESQPDFQFLIELGQESVVLDEWCGWGNVTMAIAPRVRNVIALAMHQQALDFIQLRAKQEGVGNIIGSVGHPGLLPIPSRTCDAVMMVDVLEWVGHSLSGINALDAQITALKQAHRVLKPGGWLHIDIENRFDYHLLLGARDIHTGLRFITLLPRRLANLYSQARRNQPYYEVIYSKQGLERLLQATDFELIEIFYRTPGYHPFKLLTKCSSRGMNWIMLKMLRRSPQHSRRMYIIRWLMTALGLQSRLTPRFSVLARRPL